MNVNLIKLIFESMFSECIFLPIHVCQKFLYKHFFLIPAGFEPIISDHLLAFESIEPLLDNGAEQERNKEKKCVFIYFKWKL